MALVVLQRSSEDSIHQNQLEHGPGQQAVGGSAWPGGWATRPPLQMSFLTAIGLWLCELMAGQV